MEKGPLLSRYHPTSLQRQISDALSYGFAPPGVTSSNLSCNLILSDIDGTCTSFLAFLFFSPSLSLLFSPSSPSHALSHSFTIKGKEYAGFTTYFYGHEGRLQFVFRTFLTLTPTHRLSSPLPLSSHRIEREKGEEEKGELVLREQEEGSGLSWQGRERERGRERSQSFREGEEDSDFLRLPSISSLDHPGVMSISSTSVFPVGCLYSNFP